MDKLKQELESPSATAKKYQGVTNGRGSNSSGFYHHARDRGKQLKWRGHGRQTQTYTPGNFPICQLCNKYGHLVIEHWNEFDVYYEPVPHKNQSQASTSNNMITTQDEAKTQKKISTQAKLYLAHQDQLHIPPNLDSQAWFT